ncbi:unnamed protein product [Moneuplotes crassus]|uniref:Uncharacterized protein n=1 Tax=Euplotes crassus TaxID=5936 RepID=A0AAD1U9V3_EUPCR|nr:unnamed protein product [Moneuplotes crassus]
MILCILESCDFWYLLALSSSIFFLICYFLLSFCGLSLGGFCVDSRLKDQAFSSSFCSILFSIISRFPGAPFRRSNCDFFLLLSVFSGALCICRLSGCIDGIGNNGGGILFTILRGFVLLISGTGSDFFIGIIFSFNFKLLILFESCCSPKGLSVRSLLFISPRFCGEVIFLDMFCQPSTPSLSFCEVSLCGCGVFCSWQFAFLFVAISTKIFLLSCGDLFQILNAINTPSIGFQIFPLMNSLWKQ